MSSGKLNVWKLALVGVMLSIGVGRQAYGQAATANLPKLNVATASSAVIYGPLWVAMVDKLFEKNGVQVNLVSAQALSTGSAMLVSGSVDVIATTAFLGLRIALEGKQLSYIMNLNNMGFRVNAMISRPGIKSVEELAAMGDKCKVIILPTGSATWALYKGVAAQYNLKCAVSTAGTPPLVLASALSGQFDAALVNPQDAYGAKDFGKANILIDPLTMTDAAAEKLYPYRHPLSTVVGLKSNLESKRDSIVRFVRALRQASEKMATMTPAELGELTKQLPDVFGTTSVPALTQQWKIQQSLFPRGPNAGFISETEWSSLIAAAPSVWGFANLDLNNPSVRYSNIVDMSYFNAAK